MIGHVDPRETIPCGSLSVRQSVEVDGGTGLIEHATPHGA